MLNRSRLSFALSLGAVLWLVSGCARQERIALTPPEGWQAEDGSWWMSDTDTTRAFRDLSTLDAMGVRAPAITYDATGGAAARRRIGEAQFKHAVKQRLIRLVRNEPEIVDSLYERLVAPGIKPGQLTGDVEGEIEKAKNAAYRVLARSFREPRTILELGKDVPIPFPDSLRGSELSGAVRMQIYLNERGEPLAIKKLDGVHPTLDAIAMRATTQMRWQPAYVLRIGKSKPIPSWTMYRIRFNAPPA